MRRAVVTGLLGQDGSYLAELLTAEGVEVHGLVRPQLSPRSAAIGHRLTARGCRPALHALDLGNADAVGRLLRDLKPDEIYHLAAEHHSAETLRSIGAIEDRFAVNTERTRILLAAAWSLPSTPACIVASSSKIFDASPSSPQTEATPIATRSAYGTARADELHLVRSFRARGLPVSAAILYNHESPRRPAAFVSRKIVSTLVQIRAGQRSTLTLGDLDTEADWGYARDYCEAMTLLARHSEPTDMIIAAGTARPVRAWVEQAAELLGIGPWERYVRVDPDLVPSSGVTLTGVPTHAERTLGWERSVPFEDLVALMVDEELRSPWPV